MMKQLLADAFAEALKDPGVLGGRRFAREALERQDCTGLDCRKVTFQSCRFSECDFSGAVFYDCIFQECRFESCRFPSGLMLASHSEHPPTIGA